MGHTALMEKLRNMKILSHDEGKETIWEMQAQMEG